MPDQLKGLYLVTTGSFGAWLAVLKPWLENIESGLRILLLLLSITSVIVGLVIAARKKPRA